MKHVDIYTMQGIRSQKPRNGVGCLILAYRTEQGTADFTKFIEIKDATANKAELITLNEALSHLKEPCELSVYTESGYIASGAEWMKSWKENGWKNSKGEEIANIQYWQEFAERSKTHEIEYKVKENHEYRGWMTTEIRKRSERYV